MNYKFKTIPKNLNKPEGLCYYGKLDQNTIDILSKNHFLIKEETNFTDIYFTKKSNMNIFKNNTTFNYMDGFSPNTNKELHIGHFSNLIIAKAFNKLGVCKKVIAMFGDTLEGTVSNEKGLKLAYSLFKKFNYSISKVFFASKLKYKGKLEEGTGNYDNTKIININDSKVVMVKSTGKTSYLYHDVALASKLNKPTLYLTGYEQKEHFNNLKTLFPNIVHLYLGLVKLNNSKMSSSEGNVILIKDLLEELNKTFKNYKLSYNVFAGYILKSSPSSDKKIDFDKINEHKNSLGLYLSYTTARYLKAGCFYIPFINNNKKLQYSYIQSLNNLDPSILFNELIEYCKYLNILYSVIKIKGNIINRLKMSIKVSILIYYTKKLGLYTIKKV